jgi:hypothetical protein
MTEDVIRHAIAASAPFDPAVQGWGEPDLSILSVLSEPPVFPLECFGSMSEWIVNAAIHKSCPKDYIGMSLLTATASLIGSSRSVAPWFGDWTEPSILWSVVVGSPSSGKSPALDAVLRPVRQIELSFAAEHEAAMATFERNAETARVLQEKWRNQVKDACDKETPAPEMPIDAMDPKRPIRPRYVIVDATIEAVANILAQQPRGLLLCRDEIAGWLSSFDRYTKGSDRPFWLESYGGRSYTVDRVKNNGEPIEIERNAVCIIGGTQPDKLTELLTTTSDDGLSARFLYCFPNTVQPQRPATVLDYGIIDRTFKTLSQLEPDEDECGRSSPRIVYLEENAAEIFDDYRRRIQIRAEECFGLMIGHYGKYPGLALRIALVLEYLEWASKDHWLEPKEISTLSMERAILFLEEYARPMAERCFADAAKPRVLLHTATLAREIRKRKARIVNKREIAREWKLPGLSNYRHVEDAITELEEANWLKHVGKTDRSVGRARADYLVNPAILEQGQ